MDGYFVTGTTRTTQLVTLNDGVPFTGCTEINECAEYGGVTATNNVLSCVDEINARTIICKPGYTATGSTGDRVRLIGSATFGGCIKIQECTVFGYSGQNPNNILSCVESAPNERTVTCRTGYYVNGGTASNRNSIVLQGNTPFLGCLDVNECLVSGFSGRPNNTRFCQQVSVNQRVITCRAGFYAVAPNVTTITLNGTAAFAGCTEINECTLYGWNNDKNVISCVDGLNNRTITCAPGYYAIASLTRSITIVANGRFAGCFDIPECALYGNSGRPSNVISCNETRPQWRTITCAKGYTVADHVSSDAGRHPSPAFTQFSIELYQSQEFYGCVPWCGDGLVIGAEACDDGNRVSGDGCDSICRNVEDGYFCSRQYGGLHCCTGIPDEIWNYWPDQITRGVDDTGYYLDCYDGWVVSNTKDNIILIDDSEGPFTLGDGAKFCGNVVLGHPQYAAVEHDEEVRFLIQSYSSFIFETEVQIMGSLTLMDSGVLRFMDGGSLVLTGSSCNAVRWPLAAGTESSQLTISGNGLITVEGVHWTTESKESSDDTEMPSTKIFLVGACASLDGTFYLDADEIPSGASPFVLLTSNSSSACVSGGPDDDTVPFHHRDHLIPGPCSNLETVVIDSTDVVITINHKDLCVGHIVAISICGAVAAILILALLFVLFGGAASGGVADENYMAL